ncbi:AAA family ATPase [Sulfitobacter sp. F26169L]|uniref:ExeA family protein n=1 Tax=Sulfitobacter sp. F26169L TaxID=2996015 RepID=UPI002260BAB4|nr:AAA family ATPase [Sulfitobacter sp. F26169L]MCX7567511.1 AAA family ATPase [Sulfitobacter sp. F26169L]
MSTVLYNDHFGFNERPFSLSPDPEFLYWSKAHMRARSVLEYGLVTRAPLTVVSGEVGTGKTTLIQELLRNADKDITIGLISNARGDRGDLLRWVLGAFDLEVDSGADYVQLFQQFQDFVVEQYSSGRHVALIVDEAQNLGMETLEELRMLTNINSGKDELLQIILVGQSELRDLIRRPQLRQFAQRVTSTYHLDPLDLKTTTDYVRHRLKHAGGSGEEIQEAAIILVHRESSGIPRMINKICDLALVYASSAGKKAVDADTIQELMDDGLILKPYNETYFMTNRIDVIDRAAE